MLLERVLTPTPAPTPDHGRRGGTFVARKNANGEDSRPRKRADGRWEARYWSEPVVGDTLVFTNTIGGSLNPSHFTQRHFKPLLKCADLPDTTWRAATRHNLYLHHLARRRQPEVGSYADGMEQRSLHVGELRSILAGMGRQRRDGRGTILTRRILFRNAAYST